MAFPKKNLTAESGPRKPALTVKVLRGLAEAKTLIEASGKRVGTTTDLGAALAWIGGTAEHRAAKSA